MTDWPHHGTISGPIVMIGFGSIGRGTLPLIERHFAFDKARLVVVDPEDKDRALVEKLGYRFIQKAVTRDNYRDLLGPLLTAGGGQGFCVNLSVDTGSVDIMTYCQDLGAFYIDTVNEPWVGFYFDASKGPEARSNYALREVTLAAKRKAVGKTTAVSCCGANPGMVSWFVKQALVNIATDLGVAFDEPKGREDWARLMLAAGVKGIHIAERDTQVSARAKPPGVFVNTWSVDGLLSEGYQPAELGWGTHEKKLPPKGHAFDHGPAHAVWIDRPGADTRVRSWCPDVGPQYGLVITHNEALSIPDYYTVRDGDRAVYRPTCHYAYHPCNDAVLSLYEANGAGELPKAQHILTAEEIVAGGDDLGVFLYGHAKGAMWYGSRLSCAEARRLAPYQNATGMQVTSAVLAAMVWAAENPAQGFVEADEMDHARCLEVQRPYLGSVECHYTDWTPLAHRINRFAEDRDKDDPWQFINFLAV